MRTKNLVATTLINIKPKIFTVALANVHHARDEYFANDQRSGGWQTAAIVHDLLVVANVSRL